MKNVCIVLIRVYQWCLSPWLGRQCRFQPTCSHYAIAAFEKYGVRSGMYLTFSRIGRCHPWHTGGYDPLP